MSAAIPQGGGGEVGATAAKLALATASSWLAALRRASSSAIRAPQAGETVPMADGNADLVHAGDHGVMKNFAVGEGEGFIFDANRAAALILEGVAGELVKLGFQVLDFRVEGGAGLGQVKSQLGEIPGGGLEIPQLRGAIRRGVALLVLGQREALGEFDPLLFSLPPREAIRALPATGQKHRR